jgi:hypothetical protein
MKNWWSPKNMTICQRDQRLVLLVRCFVIVPAVRKLLLKVAGGKNYAGSELILLQQR